MYTKKIKFHKMKKIKFIKLMIGFTFTISSILFS